MVTLSILLVAVFWLAYSNGANDNFKGVATLYGSGAARYRTALTGATLATLAGSLVSITLAGSLAHAFTGKGLVPVELTRSGELLVAVAAAGATTILLATYLGMPTSTTHALTGALTGIALVTGFEHANLAALWSGFLLPLLVSPLLAIGGALAIYPLLHRCRIKLGLTRQTCVCVGDAPPQPVILSQRGSALLASPVGGGPGIVVGSHAECIERYGGRVAGVGVSEVVNGAHALSGMAVCFARALNDTPKIAALLLAAGAGASESVGKLGLVAGAMALGGVLSARRVAETMSRRIAHLNPGQGLTGNLVTAALVLGASRLGLPVSTTHVSCGALFGIGAASRTARWKTIGQIALTWVTTLPLGAALAAAI
ncbi:MAG: inorganic phosphate transporter, partial [Planctomycetota bacterium]